MFHAIFETFSQAGVKVSLILSLFAAATPEAASLSKAAVLGLGFVLGLKHALEADHLAAVTTIVSERKSLLGSSLVGGLWGVGHTLALLAAGAAVIVLRVRIGERTTLALEFAVGVMLVLLGANALRKLFRKGARLHLHTHRHGGWLHAHPHLHDDSKLVHTTTAATTHHGFNLNARPLLIGIVHGLAGSAALMLLVLSTIPSPLAALAYVCVFGVGSIGGMIAMSTLVGLPIHLTAGRFLRLNFAVRAFAGLFSFGFGLLLMYRIGYVEGLLR
jgi:high-affinity nickel-transport protein